jgi:hypothetical protein
MDNRKDEIQLNTQENTQNTTQNNLQEERAKKFLKIGGGALMLVLCIAMSVLWILKAVAALCWL